MLAPGSTIQSISFAFRYVTGYETTPSGHGTNLSLAVSQDYLQPSGDVIYNSPHFTEYSYHVNQSNYSLPVQVDVSGLSIAASAKYTSRLQLVFANNDRNLQILIPFQVNITCTGADECLVAPPGPPPPLPPLPPTPPPPATHTPWTAIGNATLTLLLRLMLPVPLSPSVSAYLPFCVCRPLCLMLPVPLSLSVSAYLPFCVCRPLRLMLPVPLSPSASDAACASVAFCVCLSAFVSDAFCVCLSAFVSDPLI